MRSLIIIEVEHGETTDPMHQFMDEASELAYNVPELTIIDTNVRVDVSDTYVVRSWDNPKTGA